MQHSKLLDVVVRNVVLVEWIGFFVDSSVFVQPLVEFQVNFGICERSDERLNFSGKPLILDVKQYRESLLYVIVALLKLIALKWTQRLD